MMKDNVTICMYSHSSYSDVWPCFFSQTDKFLPQYNKKVVFADDDLGKIPEGWGFIKYRDEDSYSERVSSCLTKVNTKLCFFHHEDHFLYDEPNHHLLDQYEDIVLNENIDFIRILRGVDPPMRPYAKTLFHIPHNSPYYFAVQPSICKTGRLLDIYKNTSVRHISEFEINVQETCRKVGARGLFHYDYEPKLGMFHYGSNVYPYVATAIVAGKWNLSGYNELCGILSEHNIDPNIRGTL